MADEPRQTEVDSADDLFLGGDEEDLEAPAEAEAGETEQDQAPFETPDSPAEEEEPPSALDEDFGAEEDYGEEEEGKPDKKRKKGFPALQYYAIPAVGVILIMALGWTFAVIARRGLIPTEEPVKTAKVEEKEDKVLPEEKVPQKPKRDLRTVKLPQQEEKEGAVKGKEGSFVAKIVGPKPEPEEKAEEKERVREEVSKEDTSEPEPDKIPERPSRPAPREAAPPPVDTGETLTVPVNHPFFIPLRGGRRRRDGGKFPELVFLNFSLNLLVSTKAAASEFNSKRALIREAIYLHYNRLAPSDLATPGRRERIRRRLVAKLDREIVHGKVKGIIFQEFYTR